MVEIIEQNYDENKKIYYDIEKKLKNNIGYNVPIDHVGSTAIPNMCGKNIIDILIGAENVEQFEGITKKLNDIGFIPSKKSKDAIYQFFSSIDVETTSGDVHIHLVIMGTERYSEFIILRDFLLNNTEEAYNYSNLKREIINNGITDRREYKTVKSEYVTSLIARAKKWYAEL